jgi:DNA-binding transcriptional regulator YiaG
VNYFAAFKESVRRLARKEIKQANAKLKRIVAQHRRDIAKLRREITAVRKQKSAPAGAIIKQASAGELEGVRFSAKSVASQRRRLGLSAAAFGKLVGVSGLTVYHWEHGKAKPRAAKLPGFIAIRSLGRREAEERLAAMNVRPSKQRKKRGPG